MTTLLTVTKIDKYPLQDSGVETLKLRIKFLQERVEQQEKKISLLEIAKKGGSDALMKEIELLRKKEARDGNL